MDTFTSMTFVNNIFFLVPSQRSTEFKTHIAYTKKKNLKYSHNPTIVYKQEPFFCKTSVYMSSLKDKEYPSLKRKGLSIGSGSYKPVNTLGAAPRNELPNSNNVSEETFLSNITMKESYAPGNDPSFSLERAKERRHRLNGLSQSLKINHSPVDVTEFQITDCFGSSVNVSAKDLRDEPAVSINLKSFHKVGGAYYRSMSRRQHLLNISKNGDYICIFESDYPKSNFLINIDTQLKSLSFAPEALVMELNEGHETIIASHYGRDNEVREYFQNNPTAKVDPSKTLSGTALHRLEKTVQLDNDNDNDLDTTERSVSRTRPIRVRTRQASKAFWSLVAEENKEDPLDIVKITDDSPIESVFVEDDYIPYEKPAPFEPDLQYTFPDNKIFRITAKDFATLYNNDWINDAVMDFCIRYDIEEAINQGVVNREDVYAFNSFFYTKLTSGKTEDYYNKVKRWVHKIDLMSFSHIIMPINEKHHWYCCIIRGLPTLLEMIKLQKEKSNDADSPDSEEMFKRWGVEIFVFDSLGLRRDNVKKPLKAFLIDYCKDKYNYDVNTDQIRVTAAKVPRQNNYNDCGLHVIYNVKKWLLNIEACESFWRKWQRGAARTIFLADERNKMRRYWIETLLKLHSEQAPAIKRSSHANEEEDDDDIVEIVDTKTIVPPPTDQPNLSPPSNQKSNAVFDNSFLNQEFGNEHIPRFVVETLNKIFPKRSLHIPDEMKKLVSAFIKDSQSNVSSEQELKEVFIRNHEVIKKEIENQNRPKNKTIRITDAVSNLRIDPGTFFCPTHKEISSGLRKDQLLEEIDARPIIKAIRTPQESDQNSNEKDAEDHATSDSEHVQVEEVNLEEDRNSRQRFTRSRQRAKQNIMDLAIFDNIDRKRRKCE